MFKATKRTLTALGVIAAAGAPSAAYATSGHNPSPRAVAIVQAQAQHRYPGVVPGSTITRYPGVVPGGTITRYAGVVPGGTMTSYPGLEAIGEPEETAQSGEPRPLPVSHLTAIGAPAVATTRGFDWGDGAIGALVVLGVMATGFAATVAARRRTNSLPRTES